MSILRTRAVAVFDPRATKCTPLIAALDTSVEVNLLNMTADCITQITDIFASRSGIDDLQVASHDSDC